MSEFFSYSKPFRRLFIEYGEIAEYTKKQHIVWHKDKSDWVFFLDTGFVTISFSIPSHNNRIIGYFTPGVIFAQAGSFFAQHDRPVSYTAETAVTTYRMPQTKFFKLIRENPAFMSEYLNMMLRNQLYLIDRIIYQGEKGIYLKCARWLLFMAKYYGKVTDNQCEITIPLTQETIADFLHTTRESVNGILHRFVDAKIITTKTKKITITNIKKLQQLLA